MIPPDIPKILFSTQTVLLHQPSSKFAIFVAEIFVSKFENLSLCQHFESCHCELLAMKN